MPTPDANSEDEGYFLVSGTDPEGELISFVINVSGAQINDDNGRAYHLAVAMRNLKKRFPGKTFHVQPSSFVVDNNGDMPGLVKNRGAVTAYIGYGYET